MICRCTLEASTISLALESATPPCKCFPPLHRHHRHHRHQHQHHCRDDLLHLLKSLLSLQSPSPCVHYSPNEPHSDFRFCFVSQFSGCSIDAVGGKRLIASSSLLGSEPRLCLCALRPCVCACVCVLVCVRVRACQSEPTACSHSVVTSAASDRAACGRPYRGQITIHYEPCAWCNIKGRRSCDLFLA